MSELKLKRSANGELLVQRFSVHRRVEHAFGIVVFVTLVITGLPQKFDTTEWGAQLIVLLGGVESTRLAHRVAGIAFSVHAVLHLLVAAIGVITGRLRAEMVPTPQDLKDAQHNLQYFFGERSHPPALPKYDYRQKFEYVGMVLGGLVMVASGIVLMFPLTVAQWIPAALIPAALVAHSSEAVLALLVLVVWHIYTVALSPDVFPIDESMFTGYMPVEELAEHHRREYDRLFPNGVSEVPGEAPRPPANRQVPPPALKPATKT